jgi:hypothetical protein
VPATVREVVEAAARADQPLSIVALAQLLKLDKSAASRRWQAARERGYLKNLEDKKGKPARIVLGDPLPRRARTPALRGDVTRPLRFCSCARDRRTPSPRLRAQRASADR